jgi:hypothetical protein
MTNENVKLKKENNLKGKLKLDCSLLKLMGKLNLTNSLNFLELLPQSLLINLAIDLK